MRMGQIVEVAGNDEPGRVVSIEYGMVFRRVANGTILLSPLSQTKLCGWIRAASLSGFKVGEAPPILPRLPSQPRRRPAILSFELGST